MLSTHPTAQEQEIQTILDKVHINKERARSDAKYYAAMKEADANSKLLTANYLEYKRIESLSNNTKIYFGDKIPEMYVNNANQKGAWKWEDIQKRLYLHALCICSCQIAPA